MQQGVTGLQQRTAERLFAELSLAAAFDSLVFGELPRMPRRAAEGLLGGAGLLGSVFDAAALPSPGKDYVIKTYRNKSFKKSLNIIIVKLNT